MNDGHDHQAIARAIDEPRPQKLFIGLMDFFCILLTGALPTRLLTSVGPCWGTAMPGFPGAYADYYEAIDQHGVKFEREPMSLAEDGQGHVHVRENLPANL